ncbi:hypothetical protein IR144_11150, partial [Rothia nasimurium]|nr:hypothetical protein [Rothia nasimurium]
PAKSNPAPGNGPTQLAPQGGTEPGNQSPAPQPPASQASAPQAANRQPAADVAEGPRGGDQAWAAHGQPRSPEPPSWSPDDWNNPVTSWSVAAIPSGNAAEAPEEQAPSAPRLRVIEGEADPVEIAKAQHPSRGPQEQQNIALARDTAQESEDADPAAQVPHEDSPHAVSLEPVPTSKGLAEQGHKDADNAALQEEAKGENSAAPQAQHQEQAPTHAPSQAPASDQAPVAYEYGDYDGGYFDDAPEDEPEYVAGVGYLKPETPQAAPPAGAPLAGAPSAPGAPLAQAAQAQASAPQTPAPQGSAQQPGGKKLSFRERHAAQIAAGQRAVQQAQAPAPAEAPEDFTPSDDDTALESSVLIGQRAVEKILGGKVIDEQPLHQG